jgi:nucleoside-diphosphate-sugar epimerase
MRALVTGGAGFIGSTLVDRLLAEGHAVDVVDDLSTGSLANLADARATPGYEMTFHRLDIREPDLVELVAHRRPEVIFHLAAQADVRVSVERPAFDAQVNIIGTLHVLEGARAAGSRKVVFAASGGTLYDGEQTRDFVYVDDVVDAFARAAQKGSGLLMNIGTGVETSVNRLHDTMAAAAGADEPAVYAPARPGELARSSLDPTRAGIHLGWEPWTTLEAGTAEVLRWFAGRQGR